MNEQLIQLLDNVGLNWKVRTENVISESGIQIPNQKVIIRDDTNVPLSIRSDEYHPFQNYELIELLDKVSQRSGLEIKNGGSFKDGARVFIQLKSNNLNLTLLGSTLTGRLFLSIHSLKKLCFLVPLPFICTKSLGENTGFIKHTFNKSGQSYPVVIIEQVTHILVFDVI
jgi:hypothetical protein